MTRYQTREGFSVSSVEGTTILVYPDGSQKIFIDTSHWHALFEPIPEAATPEGDQEVVAHTSAELFGGPTRQELPSPVSPRSDDPDNRHPPMLEPGEPISAIAELTRLGGDYEPPRVLDFIEPPVYREQLRAHLEMIVRAWSVAIKERAGLRARVAELEAEARRWKEQCIKLQQISVLKP